MPSSSPYSIFTQAVLAGYSPEPQPEMPSPAVPPISPSVGFTHSSMEEVELALAGPGGSGSDPAGYIYQRHGGPTQSAFEQAVAELEEAAEALSFSSGMAALHAAILACVAPGGVIVAAKQLYGTTLTLLEWLAGSMHIEVQRVDFLETTTAEEAIERYHPAAVLCEVLTNPLARVVQLDRIAAACQMVGARLIVDNTFASPFLIKPLQHGASLVVHSATKFLNGHGDVTAGVLAGSPDLIRSARGYRRVLGATMGSFDAWLALRGLRTFAIRMKQACLGARQVAAWLTTHPHIERVYYPGLSNDAFHNTARNLFRRNSFGAMLALECKTSVRSEIFAMAERLKVIRRVTSLGDVNTLISHPVTSSHRGLDMELLRAQGITEGTLRLSIGIEEPNDLIGDLEQALAIFG